MITLRNFLNMIASYTSIAIEIADYYGELLFYKDSGSSKLIPIEICDEYVNAFSIENGILTVWLEEF